MKASGFSGWGAGGKFDYRGGRVESFTRTAASFPSLLIFSQLTVFGERIDCSAPGTAVSYRPEKPAGHEEVFLQHGGWTSRAASQANVDISRLVNFLRNRAEIQRPSIHAGAAAKAPVDPPGKPGKQEQRPFVTATQQRQAARARRRGIPAIQKRQGSVERPRPRMTQACRALNHPRQIR